MIQSRFSSYMRKNINRNKSLPKSKASSCLAISNYMPIIPSKGVLVHKFVHLTPAPFFFLSTENSHRKQTYHKPHDDPCRQFGGSLRHLCGSRLITC